MTGAALHPVTAGELSRARAVAAEVPDPELPMVTVADLGILRSVTAGPDGVVVTITPTYSGCPAMTEISADLRARLAAAGFDAVQVRTQLAPPWSTDWITPQGRDRLRAAGIAPPSGSAAAGGVGSGAGTSGMGTGRPPRVPLSLGLTRRRVACPRCGSSDTVETATFSATACKALYRCRGCAEPFEYVKEI